MIKSPFFNEDDRLFMEVEKLMEKHGHDGFFMVVMDDTGPNIGKFKAMSNFVSEGLVECLTDITGQMEQQIEDYENGDGEIRDN
jgi:hypothetical protein